MQAGAAAGMRAYVAVAFDHGGFGGRSINWLRRIKQARTLLPNFIQRLREGVSIVRLRV